MKSLFQIEFMRYFLLTRPYSWLSVSFVSILASIFVNGAVIFPDFLIDLLFGILIWISCNLFAERFSRDMLERGKIFLPVPISIFLLVVLIAIFRNFLVLGFLGLILISLLIYGKKNKYWLIGKVSFFIRGIMEVSLFLSILLFYNFSFVGLEWAYLLIWVYFITCGRNLIGDVRDLKYDKKTLPVFIGPELSKILVLILYLIPFFVSGSILISHLIVLGLIIFIKDYYNMHKILVLINMFIFFELVVTLLNTDLIFITGCLIFGVLMTLLYDKVPRKSNPLPKNN